MVDLCVSEKDSVCVEKNPAEYDLYVLGKNTDLNWLTLGEYPPARIQLLLGTSGPV
jgi:hypothetical protein